MKAVEQRSTPQTDNLGRTPDYWQAKPFTRRFLIDLISSAPWRVAAIILSAASASVFEGIALAMLFPLLAILGFSGEGDLSETGQRIATIFAKFGLTLNIYSAVAFLIVMVGLQHCFFLAQTWMAASLQTNYTARWRRELTDALLRCKWLFFSGKNAGELSHVLNFETGRASHLINYSMQVVSFFLAAAVYLVVAIVASWKVTFVLIVGGVAVLVISQFVVRRPAVLSAQQTALHTNYAGKSTEALGGMKLIRAMNADGAVRGALWPSIANLQKIERKVVMHPALLRSSFEISAVIALMGTLVIAIGTMGSDGATVLLICALFLRLYPRVSAVQQYIHQFRMAVPYYAAVIDLLDEAQQAAEPLSSPGIPISNRLLPPSLTLQNVDVRYGDRVALRDLSLSIPARSTVAIAGASGAGKSTLVDALLCLVPIQSGTIAVDGVSISDIDLATWRRSVGYVPQDTFLFNASIRDNIAFAQPDIGMNEIRDVARKAHILEFVESLPDGFDTIVGDRGVLLSGGQRQRIGIARALAGGKALLILDEATSALDSDTESAIMRDISDLHGQMTIIIIAHRLSTLRSADQIFVLDNGMLVEEGNWSSLVTRGGYFQRLWAMQTELPSSSSAIHPAARQAIS